MIPLWWFWDAGSAAPPVTVSPTVFLTGNVQRNAAAAGNVQRNTAVTGNAQRSVVLTADARVNA